MKYNLYIAKIIEKKNNKFTTKIIKTTALICSRYCRYNVAPS